MKKTLFAVCFLTTVLFFSGPTLAEDRIIHLASLEWPPYIGEHLPDQGAMALIARSAFAKAGYELRIDFYPWARTLYMAKTKDKYAGYFPEYYSQESEKDFIFSAPVGSSPLGFAERKENPVNWETADDLSAVKMIGTVRGYVNTEAFDQKAAKGDIRVEAVTDDATNLRKIIGGRITMAVIDRYVMQYLLHTDPDLKKKKDQLGFNDRLLEEKQLHICFRKNEKGEAAAKIFSEGLREINIENAVKEYFEKIMPK